MGKLLKRIRGAIGMGLTWAVAASFVGTIPRWVFGVKTDAPIPIIFGVLAFLAGLVFSGLLVLTEGRRVFDQLTIKRFAAWGALGGLLLSGIWSVLVSLSLADALIIAPTFAAASALCASGSLALARRAKMQELPGGDEQPRISSV